MKTYNITNRISKQAKREIERIISTHENYKKSYFFNPETTSGGRCKNERNFIKNNPDISFIKGDESINVKMSYSESCKNVYYSLSITATSKNGNVVGKNISTIKSILNNQTIKK